MILYYGNQDREMVPQYGGGNKNNDYGRGFYTTEDIELAKEWAYSGYNKSADGHWLHTYDIDLDKCNVYYLNDDDIMCWLSQLYTHRDIGEPIEVEDYYRNKYVNRDRIARNEYQLKAKNVKYDSQKETIDMIYISILSDFWNSILNLI